MRSLVTTIQMTQRPSNARFKDVLDADNKASVCVFYILYKLIEHS